MRTVRLTTVSAAAAILLGALASGEAAATACPGIAVRTSVPGLVTLAAERETSARCRRLSARLRALAIEESKARSAASRSRGADQRARAEVRLRRQMLNQAGCNRPMKPGDPKARHCFNLKSRLRMAQQRARSGPVYSATPSAELARIRRERQEVQAQYRLSGCPGGRVGN